MEIIVLFVILVVVKSVLDSQKAKDQSKSREAQRQGAQERLEDHGTPRPAAGKAHREKPKGAPAAGKQNSGAGQKPAAAKKKPPQTKSGAKGAHGQGEGHKNATAAAAAHVKVKPSEQTRHERLTPSVRPVKSVFEQSDDCGHRMELNPHINYSAQHEEQANREKVKIAHDRDAVLQGIIWSEILGKPKALQRRY